MGRCLLVSFLVWGALGFSFGKTLFAAEAPIDSEGKSFKIVEILAPSSKDDDSENADEEDALKPFDQIAPDAEKIGGLIPMFRKKDKLYAEIGHSQRDKDYIIVVSIAKGIGSSWLYTGQTWDAWDGDMVWQFHKVDDRIQIVRRNYRFQAESGTTEAKSLEKQFTDSILYSLPIVSAGPSGGDVIDLTHIFMSDMPGIARYALTGYSFASDRSNWEKVKGFPENMELEIAATYTSSSSGDAFEGRVLDARGVTVNVHYSISELPDSGYQPRYADERVGYFTTAIKNLNKNADDNHFVRYINRWNLQKLEPSAEKSLPKKPIVFWLDKTTPYQYRKPIRDGILEWNKAFEEAGFYNAIEVRQQEDNDDWDPEDIHYNTIRWSSANLGFAIGPSRVNPMTGEILDADVVLDVGFINGWNKTYELFTPLDLAKAFCGQSDFLNELKYSSLAEKKGTSGNPAKPNRFAGIDLQKVRTCDESLFFSQQMGLATTFFDVMSDHKLYADASGAALAEAKEGEEKDAETKDGEVKEGEKKEDDSKDAESKDEKKAKSYHICLVCGKPIREDEDSKETDAKKDKGAQVNQDDKAPQAQDSSAQDGKMEENPDKEIEFCSCPKRDYELERQKLIDQGIRYIATHEVGHTLGLRHNFKLSSLHSLEEINNPQGDSPYGYGGSIMEYVPANIMPEGERQGDFYPTRLGEYDYWAIRYGYETHRGGTDGELDDLKKIASEQSKPELNYATDEDRIFSADPLVNVWDLGGPLEFAQMRVRLFNQILPGLTDRIVKDGESYNKLKSRFYSLLNAYGSSMYFASRFVGGVEVHRDFKGDPNARPTFVPTPAAKQREALKFLTDELFSLRVERFSPKLVNYLAPNRWYHWGNTIGGYDEDLEDLVLIWQKIILQLLLSSETTSRIADMEYRMAPNEDIFTLAELFETLTDSIFMELDHLESGTFEGRNQAITSVRRNLQREYVNLIADRALGKPGDLLEALLGESRQNDISALAYYQLQKVEKKIGSVLSSENVTLDLYTRAHLTELRVRIQKTLDASMTRDSGLTGLL